MRDVIVAAGEDNPTRQSEQELEYQRKEILNTAILIKYTTSEDFWAKPEIK